MPLFAVRIGTAPGVSDSDDLDRIDGLLDETLVRRLTLGVGKDGSLSANCEVDAETAIAAAQQASLWLRAVIGVEERELVELDVGPA